MIKKRLILIFLMLVSIPGGIYAQGNRDTLARAVIQNVYQPLPYILEFDIRLVRLDTCWERWANGTFVVGFDSLDYYITPDKDQIEIIKDSIQLFLKPMSGTLPIDGYFVTAKVLNGRISIAIAGPEDYRDANIIPPDTGLRLGRFRLKSVDTTVVYPASPKWKGDNSRDHFYYQACAYKLELDSLMAPNIVYAYENDNLEMDDGITTCVKYDYGANPSYYMDIKNFKATYVGSKTVSITWTTLNEAYNRGFLIARATKPPYVVDPATLNFSDTIASFRYPGYSNEGLKGLGTTLYGRDYRYEFDTVHYRDETYCYKLLYENFSGQVVDSMIIDCVPIPHSVISSAYAAPNPFHDKTTIYFVLDDDVYLTATVYDVKAREVKKLQDKDGREINHLHMKRGSYTASFDMPELVAQGMYDVIFIADPIDDSVVEKSTAVVKMNFIKP